MLWLLTRPLGFVVRPIGLLMRGDFRGLVALLLGFALLGGLWETALFSLSTPANATAVMTEAGVAVINPALGTMGAGPAVLANIQADGTRHPNAVVTIPGLKTQAIGLTEGQLTGLTFDQATREIYGNVARAYYVGGPDAVFSVSMPTVSLLPDTHLDWLAALGFSAATLTANGHAQSQQLALYLWGAAGVLGLLVLALSKGWSRLYALSQAIFSGAVPGLALIGVVALLWQRAPGLFAPFAALLHAIGLAVVPVYVGAGIAALGALILGAVGSAFTKGASVAVKTAKSVRGTPIPVGAGRATPSTLSAQGAGSSYRPYSPAQAPSAYSNMQGSNMQGSQRAAPGPAAGWASGTAAGSVSGYGAAHSQGSQVPRYSASQSAGWGYEPGHDVGRGQQSGWGAAQVAGQAAGQASSYGRQYAAPYGRSGSESAWPSSDELDETYEGRMLQPTGTDGPAADAWLIEQRPPRPQTAERRGNPAGYPDYQG